MIENSKHVAKRGFYKNFESHVRKITFENDLNLL